VSVSAFDLLLYAGAIFLLFLTPGPVWVALIARAVSGGFVAAVPLAFGVVVGDVIWPLVAIFGVSYLVSLYADFMVVLKYIGAAMFLGMGIILLRKPDADLSADKRLNAPGVLAGFMAGVLVILSNPKAVLFYMGVLPGFFDFRQITALDMVAICAISMSVPLICNLIMAAMVHRARTVLRSPIAVRRLNIGAGLALATVGFLIALT
jgi:threonine/homoserine/homoserine lactone efflux protein